MTEVELSEQEEAKTTTPQPRHLRVQSSTLTSASKLEADNYLSNMVENLATENRQAEGKAESGDPDRNVKTFEEIIYAKEDETQEGASSLNEPTPLLAGSQSKTELLKQEDAGSPKKEG